MKTTSKIALSGLLLCSIALTGCSSSSSSGSSSDSANGCFSQDVQGSTVNITNTCDKTIVVKTTEGDRRVIAPGENQTLPAPTSSAARFAACFSPDEPKFDGSEFTCE